MTEPRSTNPIVELAEMLRLVADQLISGANYSMQDNLGHLEYKKRVPPINAGEHATYVGGHGINLTARDAIHRLEAIRKLGSDIHERYCNTEYPNAPRKAAPLLDADERNALYWMALGVETVYAHAFVRIGLISIHDAETKTERELFRNKRVGRKTLKALKEVLRDHGTALVGDADG